MRNTCWAGASAASWGSAGTDRHRIRSFPLSVTPAVSRDPSWIDEISDEQCKEIFWLYLESPDEFLAAHPAPLLGAAMRFALRRVLEDEAARVAAAAPGGAIAEAPTGG